MSQEVQSRGQERKPRMKSQEAAGKNGRRDDGNVCRNTSGVQNGPQAHCQPGHEARLEVAHPSLSPRFYHTSREQKKVEMRRK